MQVVAEIWIPGTGRCSYWHADNNHVAGDYFNTGRTVDNYQSTITAD